MIGGSVGAYRGCVGGLNGFSSVSLSFTIDRTRPTMSTKKPMATTPAIPRMIRPILICLGTSVCRRLRGFRKTLDGIGDRIDQASLIAAVQHCLGIRHIVQI